mmetsp:Transcript_19646/g.30312  ORF Transcript_19646/g.30312 Transcript_19646/m.30312 type:complete len:105 (+) Transcript_19646:963-1277(+)
MVSKLQKSRDHSGLMHPHRPNNDSGILNFGDTDSELKNATGQRPLVKPSTLSNLFSGDPNIEMTDQAAKRKDDDRRMKRPGTSKEHRVPSIPEAYGTTTSLALR